MKSKKSRHKLLAIRFLSNISLDGKNYSHESVSHCPSTAFTTTDNDTVKTTANIHPQDLLHCSSQCGKSDKKTAAAQDDIHNENGFLSLPETVHFHKSHTSNLNSNVPLRTDALAIDLQCMHNTENCSSINSVVHKTQTDIPCLLATDCGYRSLEGLNQKCVTTLGRSSEELYLTQLSSVINDVRSRAKTSDNSLFDVSPSIYKRIALRTSGPNGSIVTIFSIIPHCRKNNSSYFKVGRRALLSTSSGTNNQRNVINSDQMNGILTQSLTDAVTFQYCVQNLLPTLNSYRLIGDEVISYAHFLQPRSGIDPPISILSSVQAYNRSSTSNYVDCGSHKDSHGKHDSIRVQPNRQSESNSLNRLDSHLVEAFCRSKRASIQSVGHSSNSVWSQQLTRKPQNIYSCHHHHNQLSSKSSMINYPDPLSVYIPFLLDDPELMVATNKRVFKLPNYLTSIIGYVRPNEHKREVNREFHERFPLIQLSLTKLRSLKSVIVQIVRRSSFDLWIAAHAHVLFEKLVLKLLINKLNRKLCASAALLISAKLNDIKGVQLSNLIQEMETNFRITRRDLFNIELCVTLGLEFCLIPSEWEILPHCQRIYKNLDLTPPPMMMNNSIYFGALPDPDCVQILI